MKKQKQKMKSEKRKMKEQLGFVLKVLNFDTVAEGGFKLGCEPANPLGDRDEI